MFEDQCTDLPKPQYAAPKAKPKVPLAHISNGPQEGCRELLFAFWEESPIASLTPGCPPGRHSCFPKLVDAIHAHTLGLKLPAGWCLSTLKGATPCDVRCQHWLPGATWGRETATVGLRWGLAAWNYDSSPCWTGVGVELDFFF